MSKMKNYNKNKRLLKDLGYTRVKSVKKKESIPDYLFSEPKRIILNKDSLNKFFPEILKVYSDQKLPEIYKISHPCRDGLRIGSYKRISAHEYKRDSVYLKS